MIFWQEGFSFDSTRDILNKDGSSRTWEKISVQEEEVALPSSWTQSLACCDTWQCFTPQMFLSALRIFFLGIFLYVFFPLLFNVPLSPATFSRDSWFQWTLWKSADYPQQKRSALVLDLAAWCFVSSCPLFPIKYTQLLSLDIVITIKVTTTTTTNTKWKSFAKGTAFLLVC